MFKVRGHTNQSNSLLYYQAPTVRNCTLNGAQRMPMHSCATSCSKSAPEFDMLVVIVTSTSQRSVCLLCAIGTVELFCLTSPMLKTRQPASECISVVNGVKLTAVTISRLPYLDISKPTQILWFQTPFWSRLSRFSYIVLRIGVRQQSQSNYLSIVR